MLYVFNIIDTPFLKMGFSSGCPWRRVARGFWNNVHPSECCGKLGWHNLELLAVFKGSLADEAAVKRALPPVTGEFWAEEMAKPLLTLLGFLGESLPLPPRPLQPPTVGREEERLPCCGGRLFHCWRCEKTFGRWHHLQQHLQSHGNVKVACQKCGIKVIKGNLRRRERGSS